MTQYLALFQRNNEPACVHQVLVTLTSEHNDEPAAVRSIALAKLIEEGHVSDGLNMASCTHLNEILTASEPTNAPVSELITDRIFELYPTSDLAEGWIIESSDCIDMAFAINDEDSAGNEYHCYLTYTRETNRFSGAFGYWTPNQGLPTDTQFSEFKSLYDLVEVERLFTGSFSESQYVTTAIPALINAVRDFMTKVSK